MEARKALLPLQKSLTASFYIFSQINRNIWTRKVETPQQNRHGDMVPIYSKQNEAFQH